MLSARGASFRYPGAGEDALSGVELTIGVGSAVAVLGPNGSGKSTLLSAIAGTLEPRRGELAVNGRVAYLPQGIEVDRDFPVDVRDVVRMGRWGRGRWFGRFSADDDAAVAAAISALGVDSIAGRRFGELSGGQRQRALLAQVVAQDAEIIALDEPLTGVDRPTAARVGELIGRWRRDGRCVLVATHDLAAAADYDLVLALNRRVVAFGPPQEVLVEPTLQETFDGAIATIGGRLVDTSHRHPGAA